ncbi:MAG: cation-translocating P-type ATPase [Eubacteriales bacterium]|nr:cation-translocating P-type ATPase [Eubacteriales bacterium]
MKEWYRMTGEAVLWELGSSRMGLLEQQAEEIRARAGENVLQERRKRRLWQVFLAQFQDLLVMILIGAAGISMVSDNLESALVILAVITMNAALGTIQHEKAQKSLEGLRALSAPVARVMRDGSLKELPSAQIVPGDVVVLETGDMAVADGRILECHNLRVDESSLTGEALGVEKQEGPIAGLTPAVLADRKNMVFSGSLVTGGRAVMAVTATGMETEIGRIAALMNAEEEKKTPLQISLDVFSGHLAAAVMLICLLVFGLNLYRGMPVLDSLMFAVALAVAAIPEALGSIVMVVQAMGTQRMAREHAVIKDLKAVESLGCVSVICSDKTGTLTQNRMTVEQVYADGQLLQPGQLQLYHPVHRYLLYGAVLDNDACLAKEGASCAKNTGDPTELALLEMARRAGVDSGGLRRAMPRQGELPFDSSRKMMSTVHSCGGERLLFVKGAADVLLDRSDEILTFGGNRPMTVERRQRLRRQNEAWSSQGLRVLALAFRPLKEENVSGQMERGLVFLGMAAMVDPPRPETGPAVQAAWRAGIRPVMITGDHKATAAAIAAKIGILKEGGQTVTGAELDAMSDEELSRRLDEISVYARVSPEHKLRIVDAWQRQGQIVAMTGDGVNDAPALKKADIGVAMGLAGTEVSRDAASMILTDDNFATIIKAVSNGRNVYRNIRHAVQFLLSGNMAGIFSVLYTSLRDLPAPFAPVHLLFINLLTDSLPAIAIGMEPQEEGLLTKPPRDPAEGILTRTFLLQILVQGGLMAVCTMLAYHTGLKTGGAGAASTMAFATLTLARLLHGFNCRSGHSMLRLGLWGNLWSVMAFELGVLFLAAVLLLPGLQVVFAAADLSLRQLAAVCVLAALPLVVIQAGKMMREAAG